MVWMTIITCLLKLNIKAKEEFLGVNKNSFNYKQEDGKRIKFYNSLAIIYNKNETEVVSIVNRKTPKEEWNEIHDRSD